MNLLGNFDYFYGCESEQFSFYRIPKMLFKDKRFKNVSAEAKILYGLMLDRMGLSQKNMWLDSENRVYIIYTIEDIIEDFSCARQKYVSKNTSVLNKFTDLNQNHWSYMDVMESANDHIGVKNKDGEAWIK